MELYLPGEPMRPFGSLMRAGQWEIHNCDTCRARPACEIYAGLQLAYTQDGLMDSALVARMGPDWRCREHQPGPRWPDDFDYRYISSLTGGPT